MTVWSHLPTILKQRHALRIAGLLALCVALITTLFFSIAAHAAPGVNKTLTFQGRLLNSSGGVVADGYYNMQFKIYQDGDGVSVGTTGSPAGTSDWQESYVNNNADQGVQVKNGYFSVTLGSKTAFGSSIDWNQDTLWLSMNVAGTAAACTTFGTAPCAADGEMLPMKRLTSVPYALNAGRVGGMAAADLIHNQNTAQQTASNFWISGTGRADTALQAPAIDTATATTLTIGAANATGITLAQDVTVAAGQTLTMAGGDTASRPASPTEGMVYFDTTTKQLLTYSNGKWQSDRSTATKIVAASNSSQAAKDGADYVADNEAVVGTGTVDGDQAQINAAISALPASGGSIYLTEGTYYLDGSIVLPNNVKLSGAGDATIVTLNNSFGSGLTFVTNSDTTNGNTNITIRDIKFDGNRPNNGSSIITAIAFTRSGTGTGASSVNGANITNTTFSTFRGGMINLGTSNNNRISNNTFVTGSSEGIEISTGVNNTISNNAFSGLTSAIDLNATTYSSITGNSIEANASTDAAISLRSVSSYNVISGNSLKSNSDIGLYIATSSHNSVTGNLLADGGGSGSDSALVIAGNADNNVISNNTIRDTTGTGYGISIESSSADNTVLSGNSLSGTGASAINDIGTGTIYSNQLDSTGKLINKSGSGTNVQTSTNSATAFQVQNAAGTSALTVDTTTNSVLVAGSLDTTTAAALTVGSTNASSITIGKSSSNIATTVLGTAIFKPTTGNDSTTSFQLQRADGTAMLVADSTNQTITFGNSASGNYTVISTSNGAITKYGTARNTKKITLNAEYTGSVLDAGSGSNNSGTMTSSVDLTNRMNYYKWTTSQATNQSYDVVVQVPLPTDFDGWASSNPLSISTYTSNTTNGTITLEARDSSNAVQCNFVSVTPGSTSTWAANNSACTLSSGTYTAGDQITLRIRMQSPTSGDVRVGNINLSYLSKY